MNTAKFAFICWTLTIALSGCSLISGQPEVAACEDFIKSALRSPSTFKSVSTTSRDSKSGDGKSDRKVSIEYDAANAFGTPIRNSQVCTFDLVDGKVFNPDAAATIAKSDRVLGMGDGSCCQMKPTPTEDAAVDPQAAATDSMPLQAEPLDKASDRSKINAEANKAADEVEAAVAASRAN